MKLIKSTPNGQITYCPCKNLFSLEFGNFFVHLSPNELKAFNQYVQSTDYEYYLSLNRDAHNRRKLILTLGSNKIFLCLHSNEFLELRELVSLKKNTGIIQNTEVINHEIIFN